MPIIGNCLGKESGKLSIDKLEISIKIIIYYDYFLNIHLMR